MRSACLSVIYIMVLMDFVMPPEDLVLPVTKIVSLSSALPDVIGSRELKNPHKHDLGLFEQGLFDDKADRLLDSRGVLSLCLLVCFRRCLLLPLPGFLMYPHAADVLAILLTLLRVFSV